MSPTHFSISSPPQQLYAFTHFKATLDSLINVALRLLISWDFSRGYALIRGGTFICFKGFLQKYYINVVKFGLNVQIFDIIGYVNLWGVWLFKGVRLLIFKKNPGGTFI